MKMKMHAIGLLSCLAMATAVGLSGCAGNRYQQSTGEYIDDHSTSSRVKGALSDDGQYKYEDVEVKTFKGVTQLSGFVNSGDQKSRATEIAKRTEGVREVENNISVKN
jgi:hyperosmotically inducible periplasmic protein